MAVSAGCERSGPTTTLHSVCKLNARQSWQCACQVNIRFHADMIAEEAMRTKRRAMLNVYFQNGGQELQINVVDTATMRRRRTRSSSATSSSASPGSANSS